MNFQGPGLPLTTTGLIHGCLALGMTASEVWTILAVETHGFGFLADRRAEILFERHVFHQLTGGRFDASHPDISNPVPGGYLGDTAEYPRLYAALDLDHDAALQSTSWGIGQLMGFNFAAAGFATIDAMIRAMVQDEDAQLCALQDFINHAGLGPALQRRDWTTFAAGYNGLAFQQNYYAIRLAAAHAKYSVALPDLSLRTAQAALRYLGIDPGPIDGFSGPRTRAALRAFQAQYRLATTGRLDPKTKAQLLDAAFPAKPSTKRRLG